MVSLCHLIKQIEAAIMFFSLFCRQTSSWKHQYKHVGTIASRNKLLSRFKRWLSISTAWFKTQNSTKVPTYMGSKKQWCSHIRCPVPWPNNIHKMYQIICITILNYSNMLAFKKNYSEHKKNKKIKHQLFILEQSHFLGWSYVELNAKQVPWPMTLRILRYT